MKTLMTILSFLLLISCVNKSDAIDGTKIGMPISEFLEIKKDNRIVKKEIISLEGDDYDIYNIYRNNEILYAVEPQCEEECTVWRIWVYSKEFKTIEGIGIGDKLGDLKKKYTLKEVITGEGRVAILVAEINLSFFLDSQKIPDSWWTNQSLNDLDDELLIEMIIIS